MKKETYTRREFLRNSFILASSIALSSRAAPSFGSERDVRTITGFKNPYAVAVDANGLIYVSDAGHYCIRIFNRRGELLRTFGKAGSGAGDLNYPQGIAVDESGDIYVMDANNGRIAIFDARGAFRNAIGKIGGYPGAFYTPKGIALDAEGHIYAANTRNHTIYRFDKMTGELTASYGILGDDPADLQEGSTEYRFRLPTAVALSGDGNVYVVDSKHGCIKLIDPEGRFIRKFGQNGSGDGQFNLPEGIALDRRQNVYVCDTLNSRLQKFTPEGRFIGALDHLFAKPTGICIDGEDNIYVVDAEEHVLKIFNWS